MINEELYERMLRERGINVPRHQGIRRTGETGPFGLSYAQRGIWFLQQMNPESAAFNNGSAVVIEGRLDVPCMQRALTEIVRRHEILNVNYRLEQGEPKAFRSEREVRLALHSWEDRGTGVNDPAVTLFINGLAGKAFDLEKDPLISFSLLRFGEAEHILVISMHHMISDGWSKGLLLQEFTRIYDAFVQGESCGEAPLPIQYRDFVQWQEDRLRDPGFRQESDFWVNKLSGAPPLLELPADRKRPSVMSGKGGLLPFRFDPELYEAVQAFCSEERVSVFNVLLAVFKTLLFRYSGAEDLLVGTPVAGRTRSELEPLIGMFVNTVVIRTRPAGELTFAEYVRQIKEEAVQAFNHQDTPFDLIVGKLNPERDRSYHPVFQTMFQLDNLPLPEMAARGIRLLPLPLDIGIAQADLSVSCRVDGGELQGTFEYSSDLFTPETIRRMITHFRQLAISALAKPNESLAELDILDDDERHLMLSTWNANHQPLPETGFCQLIEQRAAQTPGQCAVLQGETPLSYGELNARADRLAGMLRSKGTSPEVPVAVCLPSSGDYVIAALAIFKAGGALTPLDPAAPPGRTAQILAALGPICVITDTRHARLLPLPADQMLLIDGGDMKLPADQVLLIDGDEMKLPADQVLLMDGDEMKLLPACAGTGSAPESGASPQQLACIIFTSGTTGVPKGVLLEHRSVDNLIHSFIASYQVQPEDRLLPITSVASASFVGEVLPILAAGGTLALPDVETVLHPGLLKAYIERHGVTILSTVPSMISRFNSEGTLPGGLRLILSGGDSLLPSQMNRLGSLSVANGYGLTESGICSTYVLMEPGADGERALTASLGRPLPNQQVYVLDNGLHPVPVGVKGEIFISGSGLARGYLNSPELTRERFIPHPFRPGDRLLRTGDTGYFLPGGELCFTGRNDRQVQIRGYRIELGEVEKHLNTYPDVMEAAVHPQRDHEGNLRLVAYYTARPGGSIIGQQLGHWLSSLLPSYMKPAAYVQLERIPMNVNGKLDVSALPQPTEIWNRAGASYEKPATAEEKAIAKVWEDILQVSQFGVDDNFFDLGGHSLLLAKVHERLKEPFGPDLKIVDLFTYPTVRSLARYVRHDQQGISAAEISEKAGNQKRAFLRYKKASASALVRDTKTEGGMNGHES
jgi:amino acid adenylation domain-containing protein